MCHAKPSTSFALPASQHDMGSVVMTMTMKEKERALKKVEECRNAETCPEKALRTSEGAVPCKDGTDQRYDPIPQEYRLAFSHGGIPNFS